MTDPYQISSIEIFGNITFNNRRPFGRLTQHIYSAIKVKYGRYMFPSVKKL